MSVEQLEGLLASTLTLNHKLDFESLKEKPEPLRFDPGELAQPLTPPIYEPPAPLGVLQKLVPGAKAKHAQAVEDAEQRHAEEKAQFEQAERDREAALAQAKTDHDEKVKAEAERVATQHNEVDMFRSGYEGRDPDAIVTYCSLILATSQYPDTFPQQHKVAYVPESQQLVIEMDLPTFDVVPEALEYRYVKTKDEIAAKARPIGQRKALYTRVVSQVTLRTVHEMFESDQAAHVESVVFNGHVRHNRPTHRQAGPALPDHATHHTRPIRQPRSCSGRARGMSPGPQCVGLDEPRRARTRPPRLGVQHG